MNCNYGIMKFSCAIVLLLAAASFSVVGQESVSSLQQAHSAALKKYLARYPKLKFLSEKRYDQAYLEFMRFEDFGKGFMPFYRYGDFNRDGRQDFAVILAKDVPPKRIRDVAETHKLEYQLRIVIFNGGRNGAYRVAFSEDVTSPLVCYLNITSDKQKRLYFGVYETDNVFTMVPRGRGYRIE